MPKKKKEEKEAKATKTSKTVKPVKVAKPAKAVKAVKPAKAEKATKIKKQEVVPTEKEATKEAPSFASLEGKRLLSSKEAMRYLNVQKVKLYELIKVGNLPTVMLDSCYRFDINDLNEFIEAKKKK